MQSDAMVDYEPESWRDTLILFCLSWSAMWAVYWDTYASMVTIWWRSGTFTHGFLIFPVVAYLVWLRRAALQRITPRPAAWGLSALLTLSLLWFVAHLADVVVIEQFAVIAMIGGFVWTLMGEEVVRAIAFPLAYMIFAVPFGEALVPLLQDYTAVFTVKALQLTNISVYKEGRFIYVPGGSFEVASACSGIRYLIASAAIGCLYAYISYRSLSRRLIFVCVALMVPLIANGLRAYGIILIAYFSDMRLATGVDHFIYGWLFFGAVMLLLFWLGSLMRENAPAGGIGPTDDARRTQKQAL